MVLLIFWAVEGPIILLKQVIETAGAVGVATFRQQPGNEVGLGGELSLAETTG